MFHFIISGRFFFLHTSFEEAINTKIQALKKSQSSLTIDDVNSLIQGSLHSSATIMSSAQVKLLSIE